MENNVLWRTIPVISPLIAVSELISLHFKLIKKLQCTFLCYLYMYIVMKAMFASTI